MSEHLRLYTWHPTAVKSLKMRGCETVSAEVRNENCKKFHTCRDAKNVGWYVCYD